MELSGDAAVDVEGGAGGKAGSGSQFTEGEERGVVVQGELEGAQVAGAAEGQRELVTGGGDVDDLSGSAEEVGQGEAGRREGGEGERGVVVVAGESVAVAVEGTPEAVEGLGAAAQGEVVGAGGQAAAADEVV